jgi:dienelactone hydrolase
MKALGFLACLWLLSPQLLAQVATEEVRYKDGETEMIGLLAWPKQAQGKRPGILVVHEWWGRVSFADEQAKKLAEMGYVALAADIYGQHRTAKDPQEAGALAGSFKNNPELFRRRLQAALQVLARHPQVDAARLAAIGFCFGGTGVLELARSGAPVRGVVSFHGGLSTRLPAEPGKIQGKILVLHGADDPAVSWDEVKAFAGEMKQAGAWWQLVAYGGAVHGFTNPANTPPNPVAAFNPEANERAWKACFSFLQEVLNP